MIESLIRFFYFFISLVIYWINLIRAFNLELIEKRTLDIIFVFNLSVLFFSIYFMSDVNYVFGLSVYTASFLSVLLIRNQRFFEKFTKLLKMDLSFDNPIHKITLSLSTYILLNPVIAFASGSGLIIALTDFLEVLDLAAFQLIILIYAFVGIGFGTRKNLKQSIERLDIKIPSIKYAIFGVILLFMVDKFIWNLFDFFTYIFQSMDPVISEQIAEQAVVETSNVNEVVNTIKISASTPLKIVFLSIIVGISEELMFRGALQPRFGNIYTSFLFAALHAQYLSSMVLLDVFIISYILGMIKERKSTSTTILIHILYDIISLIF
ncbi:CPBP family intramembrane glutamic endopeptidase [Methanococcus maripaludis]|uniref:Membrane protease YdiL (CAAX protease family) n=2 Tax=Methanococcus maripaludis TaxID=39152 RepID=A0A7J9PH83_METMI|nr:CPBP family intramembrane glutamic endopeptidase [Methanococcus maripaludis]MBA2862592.1 membrane protease YdiL (CAAX protease family) [Methanococcus maripaludis]